jgi:tetratricopeptide (TPR) repeat protein
LYYEKNKSILFKRIEYLKKALDSIFSISDESITANIIQAMYDIASFKKIPINIVESTTLMPGYLSNETKCSLYLYAVAWTYRILQMYSEMLENCNKALLLQPEHITGLNAKAVALGFLKKYDEAVECCDKIIEIDPKDVAAWASKGLALSGLKRNEEAVKCWKKAVEIDDNYVGMWNKKIHSLQDSKGYDDSMLIRILIVKLAGKGMSYAFIKKYNESLECSNKALELDPNNTDNLNNKAWALNGLKRCEEALECSNKALELDPNSIPDWYTS